MEYDPTEDPIGPDPPPYRLPERARDSQKLVRLDVAIAEIHVLQTRIVIDLLPSWMEFLKGKIANAVVSALSLIATLIGAGAVAFVAKLVYEIMGIRAAASQINRRFADCRESIRESVLPNAGGGKFRRVVRSRNRGS